MHNKEHVILACEAKLLVLMPGSASPGVVSPLLCLGLNFP